MENYNPEIDFEQLLELIKDGVTQLPAVYDCFNDSQWANVFESLTNEHRLKLAQLLTPELLGKAIVEAMFL